MIKSDQGIPTFHAPIFKEHFSNARDQFEGFLFVCFPDLGALSTFVANPLDFDLNPSIYSICLTGLQYIIFALIECQLSWIFVLPSKS